MKRKNFYDPPESEFLLLWTETNYLESVNKNFSTPHDSNDPFPEMTDVDIAAGDWQ